MEHGTFVNHNIKATGWVLVRHSGLHHRRIRIEVLVLVHTLVVIVLELVLRDRLFLVAEDSVFEFLDCTHCHALHN